MSKTPQFSHAKRRLLHKGCTMDGLKTKLRSEFKAHIRNMRSKSFDIKRDLTQDDTQQIYKTIMRDLQRELQDGGDVQPDEALIDILKETQNEFLQELINFQANEYVTFQTQQVDAIVENLITCKICGCFCEQDVCYECTVFNFAIENIPELQ